MRALPPRLLLIIGAVLTGLAVIALVLLSAAGIVEPASAVQIALSFAILAMAAMIVADGRRTDGKALRIDARTKRQDAALARTEQALAQLATELEGLPGRLEDAGRHQARVLLSALGEDRMELTAQTDRLAQLASAVARVDATVRQSADDLDDLRKLRHDHEQLTGLTGTAVQGLRDLAERLDALGGTVREGQADLAKSARQNYAQLEALIDIRALLQPRAPLPRLRGWAASPDVLRLLIERIAVDPAKVVVECGSGSSSVWLGYAVQRFGGGRVVALEHDERFAEASRDLVLAHGLQDVVEIRHAPLTSWTPPGDGAETIPWYDPRAVADLSDIGLVFVDGPPGATAQLVRYPAVPVLLPHCAADAWIVLDDTNRPGEREVADRWLLEYPELAGTAHPAEKGAMVLRRSAV
ncbi:class I SAM-dependent methyltransferase [Sphaerisporangium sp. NPDC049003]|uniref:class I SAM-dependent methyltransferase n=1 Tax=Sphaerisporangium sp. NPDC049003 TaxID=3364517 RepID=UPI0037107518